MRFQEIQEACWTGYRQAGMKKKGDRQVPNCVPVEEVKIGPEITGRDLLFKAAAMAMRDAGREGISLDYEQAIKQASKIYGIPYTPSELPKLLAQRAEIDRQLALLKQGKQVVKARRQAKRAPTPAGAEEYWRTHALPTDRIKPATKTLEETEAELAEDLKKWFKEKWVRFGPDGKIRGACARGSSKEGKPKCLPQSKAHALGKKGRASAAAKKRREDSNPERRGPARNVATKVREAGSPAQQAAIAIAMKKAGKKPKQGVAEVSKIKTFYAPDGKTVTYDPSKDHTSAPVDKKVGTTKKTTVSSRTKTFYAPDGKTVTYNPNKGVAEGNNDNWYDDADEFGMPGSEFFPEKQPRGHYKVYYMTATDHKLMGRYATQDEAEQRVKELKAEYPDNTFIVFASQRGMKEQQELDEKQDACYRKVKSRYKVWPSAYASGALVQCRKKGAANWGNKKK